MRIYVNANPLSYGKKLNELPPLRRKYAESITSEKSRALSVCAYYTAVFALSSEFPFVNTADIDLDRDEYGMPFFVRNGIKQDCSVSISHCSECCAAIVGKTPAGIDVESKYRKINGNIIKRVCCEQEISYLENLGEKETAEEFIKMWTKKEAFFKIYGKSGFGEGFRRLNTFAMRGVKCIEYSGMFISVAVA